MGLRPGRSPLRLESEELRSVPVVHCYGHGGSGITLAMGCAEDVVANHVAPRLQLTNAQKSVGGAKKPAYKVDFKPRSKL